MITRLLLILIAISSSAFAEDESPVKEARWYKVNLTLFQQKPDSHLDESFKFTPMPLDMADVIELKRFFFENVHGCGRFSMPIRTFSN